MRLTVRTLLAWIDGVLGPAEHGELGTKVAGSQVAPRLIERIQGVVENPSLSAPVTVGRGLADDPNTAAEFLDNVLDSERLEAFERVCIESDMHLADVAGCHRILAEALRNPDAVEGFELARGRIALEAARRAVRGPTPASVAGRRAGRTTTTVAPEPARRRATLAAWLSAAAALALIVGLGAALAWTLTRDRPVRVRQVAGDRSAPVPPAQPPQPPMVVEPAAVVPETPPQVRTAPVAAEAEMQVATTDPPAEAAPAVAAAEPPPPSPPAEVPPAEAAPPKPQPDDRTVPFGAAMAIGGGPGPDPNARPPATGAAADVASSPAGGDDVPERTGAAILEGTVLVRAIADGAAWRSAKSADPLGGDEQGPFDVVAAAGSYPLITVGDVTIRLHPGTRVVVAPAAAAAPAITIVHGRAVIEGAGDVSWPAVVAGGLRGALGVVARQPAGVEVASDPPAGIGPHGAAPPRAAIHAGAFARPWRQAAADGTGRPLIGLPNEVLIPADTALRWDGRDPATARLEPCVAPAWMQETAAADRIWRRAAGDLAAFLAGVPGDAAIEALRRRSAAGLPEDRAAAAATLAFLGEHAELVDLLCDDPPRGLGEAQWLMVEAMTVPVVVARGGPEAESLLAAFRDRAPAGSAVAALARGPADEELARDGGAALVAALDDASLVVRRYAIVRLRELVPDDARHDDDYRADRAAAERGESVKWWRALAARGGIRRGAEPAAAPPAAGGGR